MLLFSDVARRSTVPGRFNNFAAKGAKQSFVLFWNTVRGTAFQKKCWLSSLFPFPVTVIVIIITSEEHSINIDRYSTVQYSSWEEVVVIASPVTRSFYCF